VPRRHRVGAPRITNGRSIVGPAKTCARGSREVSDQYADLTLHLRPVPVLVFDQRPSGDCATLSVVERFHPSLKCKHLQQREIDTAAELAEEVATCLSLYNETRPHEALASGGRLSCTAVSHTCFVTNSPSSLTQYTTRRRQCPPPGRPAGRRHTSLPNGRSPVSGGPEQRHVAIVRIAERRCHTTRHLDRSSHSLPPKALLQGLRACIIVSRAEGSWHAAARPPQGRPQGSSRRPQPSSRGPA
jgi:hypothetical protein